jgi:hypothetical protein
VPQQEQVTVFDGYGHREYLEKKLNDWLSASPRKILSIKACDMRLFIRWRPAQDFSRHAPAFIKLWDTMANGETEALFRQFYKEHPTAKIIFEEINVWFLFWFWADET